MMSFALVSVFFMAYILTLVIVPKPRKETTAEEQKKND